MEWVEAHNQLLAEEAKLLHLCRQAGSRVNSRDVNEQRKRVAELTEVAERLYASALEYLQSSSS